MTLTELRKRWGKRWVFKVAWNDWAEAWEASASRRRPVSTERPLYTVGIWARLRRTAIKAVNAALEQMPEEANDVQ